MKVKKLNEGGFGRLWQLTQDDSTFAIIGSQDKDTKKDRFSELKSLVMKYASNHKENKIGWKHILGTYTYDDNERPEEEDSLIIYNISKSAALKIANTINQESIVWKDDSFFGIIYSDGREMMSFTDDPKNFDFTNVKGFSSQFKKGKNSGIPFNFREGVQRAKIEVIVPDNLGHGMVYYMNPKNATTHKELIWEGLLNDS